MNAIPKNKIARERWANDRGAALITTLLVSTMLLTLGGALILVTNMASGLAIDSTSELQAYYAAEAGTNAAVNVLRGNVQSISGSTAATFRNAVTSGTLNTWLNYNTTIDGNLAVSLGTTPIVGYSIAAGDPDSLPVAKQPTRLLLQVTGYGPRGSSKRMEVMVDRYILDYSALATILIRGNDDNSTTMGFAIGSSNSKIYSGIDNANASNLIPAIGTTHTNDYNKAVTEVSGAKPGTVYGSEQVKQFSNSQLPSFLQTADKARSFLNMMQIVAQNNGRYFGPSAGTFGSDSDPQLTFIDGDCAVVGGTGLLIVTGTLELSGTPSFHGLILVLGQGNIFRTGGGNGDILGAIAVARFARSWPAAENGQAHPFLEPSYDTGGGGDSTISFDTTHLDRALSTTPPRVVAIRER